LSELNKNKKWKKQKLIDTVRHYTVCTTSLSISTGDSKIQLN